MTTNYRIETATGKEITVSVRVYERLALVSVYIQQNGTANPLSYGRHFNCDTADEAFRRAIDSYKARHIKDALNLVYELPEVYTIDHAVAN